MKKLYLDTERIVYRLYLGEGMSALGAKAALGGIPFLF